MKVALLAGYKHGAIDQVMRELQKHVTAAGETCDLFNVYATEGQEGYVSDKTFGAYDLVHAGYFQYLSFYDGYLVPPTTANVWHIPIGREEEYGQRLHNWSVERIVVDDVMTFQQLGQLGFENCDYISIMFDGSKFKPLPVPEGPFTVGVFCNNYPYKRWEVVAQACQDVGVVCHAMITPQDRKTYDVDPVEDVYKHVHVLASATFIDTNSLPLREALLCGRPVISTHNDGMRRVVQDGVNGAFFDGSRAGLVDAIKLVQSQYQHFRVNAIDTDMPDNYLLACQYMNMWSRVLEKLA